MERGHGSHDLLASLHSLCFSSGHSVVRLGQNNGQSGGERACVKALDQFLLIIWKAGGGEGRTQDPISKHIPVEKKKEMLLFI